MEHDTARRGGFSWRLISGRARYWSGEDNAFIAEVPELAGCTADGPTYADALSSVTQIAEEWIETARSLGRPIPSPGDD